MSALELLAAIEQRGATARAEIGGDGFTACGAAVLVVAPRAVIGDLLPALARFKPQLLELLAQARDAPTANGFTGTATAPKALPQARDATRPTVNGETVATAPDTPANGETDDDARALELLARYRRGGAAVALEVIEHGGGDWLALACDLTGVASEQREHAFEQIERNARQLQRALELEAAPEARPKALPEVRA